MHHFGSPLVHFSMQYMVQAAAAQSFVVGQLRRRLGLREHAVIVHLHRQQSRIFPSMLEEATDSKVFKQI